MKKLMRKLVLSSFALGLAVITLSTTTFAWYTSNKEVSANNILGQSSTSGSDLLMISQDNAKWGTSVDVLYGDNTTTTVAETNNTVDLQPVQVSLGTNDIVFNTWGDNGVSSNNGVDKVLAFTLYFKFASNKANNHLFLTTLNLTNKTAEEGELPKKDVLANANQHIDNGNTAVYDVDILRTIMLAVDIDTVVGSTTTPSKPLLFNPEGLVSATFDDSLKGHESTFNAHKYYNAVMGLTDADGETQKTDQPTKIATTDTSAAKDAKELFNNASGKLTYKEGENSKGVDLGVLPCADNATNRGDHLVITFYVFINGWDLACFDAVQGQKIALSMEFSTVDPTAPVTA